ncbi:MAG: MmgE/PrpD family protein [Proteobacteria bacterium]|nr:MmgE/PrpD family protein [Pseudomonadota bacterium]
MSGKEDKPGPGPVIGELASYIAAARDRPLPAEVAAKTGLHLLDTLAAIVSGSALRPGEIAAEYVRGLGGTQESVVIGSDIVTTAGNAALANAMAAHADETDDSHFSSRSHLGCAVVPAALAMAERQGRSGEALLNAVALGYDIGARATLSLGADQLYEAGHSTHSFAPLFGAAAASGALAGLGADQVRWMLSYTAQQASGVNCWARDEGHVEKAFDFAGMPARNGVAAATMVAAGFTGVDDVFTGPRNFFFAFSPEPRPELLIDGLGSRFEIMATNIKKWSVGSPIQAALDSVQALIEEHGLEAADIQRIRVKMSEKESHVIDNRAMPDINLQHLLSLLVLDGGLTFLSSHDYGRMEDAEVLAFRQRIELVADADLPRRQPVVEIETAGGQSFSHRTMAVRGTPENPMTPHEVEAKADDLMAPVLGAARSAELIAMIRDIGALGDARELRPLLTA